MATKSKKENIFANLVKVQKSLELLDQFIDVDRLLGISNAQGPIAKTLRDILRPEAMEELEHLPKDVSRKRSAANISKRKALSS